MNAVPDGFVPLGQEGTFLGHVGGLMWRRGADRTEVCVSPAPHHLNPNGTAHGGFLMTVLDITLGATVESFLGVNAGPSSRDAATVVLDDGTRAWW